MARKQYTIHYIYKITNTLNDNFYIGMHSTFNLEDGYMGSGKRIVNSIRKHGVENHKKEILEFYKDRKELKAREKEIVNEEFLKDPRCMNIQPGGEGGWCNNPNSLIPFRDPIIRKNNVEKSKNTIKFKKENIPGYKESWSKKITDANIRRNLQFGSHWTGKHHSEETKEKMKRTIRERKLCIGERNSQFGTCWIYNNYKNKKIKKEELDQHIKLGWSKGRKLNNILCTL